MRTSRRYALETVFGAAGALIAGAALGYAQVPAGQKPSATASGEDTVDPKLDPKRTKTILEQNQKDLKKDIQKLFQLATDLKDEAEKTDAMNTLSVPLLKKTEEIEKLARQIRDKARG